MLLTNQYQDYEAAQGYFMKALESDPRNAEACQHAHGYWRGTAGRSREYLLQMRRQGAATDVRWAS